MTDDQILEVVSARKAGKRIQERHLDQEDWYNMRVPQGMWNLSLYEYRVAPEPREYWICITKGVWKYAFGDKDSAKNFISEMSGAAVIHVREVLP
jgi:hypothetical protein